MQQLFEICSLSDSSTKWALLYHKPWGKTSSYFSYWCHLPQKHVWSVRNKNEALFPWWKNATWCLAECKHLELPWKWLPRAESLPQTLWRDSLCGGGNKSQVTARVTLQLLSLSSFSSLRGQKGEQPLTLIVQCSKTYVRQMCYLCPGTAEQGGTWVCTWEEQRSIAGAWGVC